MAFQGYDSRIEAQKRQDDWDDREWRRMIALAGQPANLIKKVCRKMCIWKDKDPVISDLEIEKVDRVFTDANVNGCWVSIDGNVVVRLPCGLV